MGADNAQWICTSSLAQSCFFRFNNHYAIQAKVVGHEYFHAISAQLRPLNYRNQSGALNESLGDVFGLVFNYWYKKDASWKIANRDLSAYIHTDHNLLPFSKRPSLQNDYGNVHTNSCIPNHAFFVAVQLIGEPRDGKAAQIWFQAFLYVDPNESFKEFAAKTIEQSQLLYGASIAEAVRGAWIHVEVLRYYIVSPIQKEYFEPEQERNGVFERF